MSKKTAAEAKPDHWTCCGIPAPIAEFVSNLPEIRAFPSRDLLRARRFRDHWVDNPDQEELLVKSWRSLESQAISPDHLISLFITWPDLPTKNPFFATFGVRKNGQLFLTPAMERDLYQEMATHVDALLGFLGRKGVPREEWLLSDASATGGEAHQSAVDFRANSGDLRTTLRHLKKALLSVDPSKKYPTKQPDAEDAAIQNYVILLAAKNKYLKQPRHTAIAYLANVNNPEFAVTAGAIKKAYSNLGDKLI